MPLYHKKHLYSLLYCVLLISTIELANTSKILFLAGVSLRSHMNYVWQIVENLHLRGHEMTVVSPFIDRARQPNISQIELTESKVAIEENLKKTIDNSKGGFVALRFSEWKMLNQYAKLFYENPYIKNMLKTKPHFDLMLLDPYMNDFVLPVAHLINTPVVYIVTCPLDSKNSYMLSLPIPYSYVPVGVTLLPEKSSFFQRLENSLIHFASLLDTIAFIKLTDYIIGNYLPTIPKIDELRRNISLTIVNADPVTDNPAPLLPNIIPTGCLQCRPAKPLPKDLEDFIQSSGKHGFILFSMGSVMIGNSWPQKTLEAFIKAFSKLKQKVIWKYDEPIKGLSDNVMLVKWLPQQDILGHPKIRLFIGHGGYLGIQEAVYHAVPYIGMPMFGCQSKHVTRAVDMGFAERMDFFQITEEEILDKITLILNNPRYKNSVSKFSKMKLQLPGYSINRALQWIEYVIQYKGAHHLLTSARHLSVPQYYMIDILLFILTILAVYTMCCYYFIKWIILRTKRTAKKKSE